MSKLALKKELALLSREQIIDVLLTAYSSNKSIKAYFDFFAVPDVDKLYDKHLRELTKEISRGKYNRSTARISRIRKSLKDFESFNPGVERVTDLRIATLKLLIDNKQAKKYSDSLINGTQRLLNDTLTYADNHCIYENTVDAVNRLFDDSADNKNRDFISFLKNNTPFP